MLGAAGAPTESDASRHAVALGPKSEDSVLASRDKAFAHKMIDREALVSRHSPRVAAVDASGGLTLGNGEFAFTACVTGLQTLNGTYAVGLQTQSHWGWHVEPATLAGVRPSDFAETPVTAYGHTAYYPLKRGPGPLLDYLRGNPHK